VSGTYGGRNEKYSFYFPEEGDKRSLKSGEIKASDVKKVYLFRK